VKRRKAITTTSANQTLQKVSSYPQVPIRDECEVNDEPSTDEQPKRKKKDQEKCDPLTLADLLEVFDGVMEMKGRMMVITTNHPEKLDPALIRPGRVDYQVNFGKCRREDIKDIFLHFYCCDSQSPEGWKDQMERKLEDAQIPAGEWTPAAVVQTLLAHPDSPEEAIKLLKGRCLKE